MPGGGGAASRPLTPADGAGGRAQEGPLSSWPEQGFPDQEGDRISWPASPAAPGTVCPALQGPQDSGSHTHPGPSPSRPGSSFPGRKPSSAWVVTISPHVSPSASPRTELSLCDHLGRFSERHRGQGGHRPPLFSALRPGSGHSVPGCPCNPSLSPGPLETLANSESVWGPANLLEVRGHLPGPQGSHVPCLARVHLQTHPAQRTAAHLLQTGTRAGED